MQRPDNSQRTSHCRVAGPMGRPAISGETPRGTVVPRGPKTPPTTGTTPGGAKTNIMPNRIRSEPQKHCGPALSRLLDVQESNKQEPDKTDLHLCRQHTYRYTKVPVQPPDTLPVLEPLPGGAREEGAGPILPIYIYIYMCVCVISCVFEILPATPTYLNIFRDSKPFKMFFVMQV